MDQNVDNGESEGIGRPYKIKLNVKSIVYYMKLHRNTNLDRSRKQRNTCSKRVGQL